MGIQVIFLAICDRCDHAEVMYQNSGADLWHDYSVSDTDIPRGWKQTGGWLLCKQCVKYVKEEAKARQITDEKRSALLQRLGQEGKGHATTHKQDSRI